MCALCVLASTLASCGGTDIDQQFPGLLRAVNVYYKAQQVGDWDRTYAMRTPHFRAITEKGYYKRQMDADSKGWNLLQFKVLSARSDNSTVSVQMRFRYSIADSGKTHVLDFPESSVWIKIDGTWYCYNAGIQYHLPQNDSFTRP